MKDYSLRDEKSRLIQATATSLHEHITELFDNGYDQDYEDGKKENCDCKDNMKGEYIRGLNEAWEAARKLALSSMEGGLDTETIVKIFDGLTYYAVFEAVSASEAVAKIKEYEQQKQDTEIKVGDEVISASGNKGIVITDVLSRDGDISVWMPTCTHVQMYPLENLIKTGRTFPQIAEVFTEMRGEE